jgi:hypothetical protein
MTRVEFHPDAVAEARSAWQWYAERSPLAASAFLSELDRAITLGERGTISVAPVRCWDSPICASPLSICPGLLRAW